ncbi:MAG: hypothetical protein CM15mP114_15660 [Alphaproteobacteria bacterium]|nr:MAG: hypothetical protein CM15mP114_15660 [Alphaproteobacteria bacterium]
MKKLQNHTNGILDRINRTIHIPSDFTAPDGNNITPDTEYPKPGLLRETHMNLLWLRNDLSTFSAHKDKPKPSSQHGDDSPRAPCLCTKESGFSVNDAVLPLQTASGHVQQTVFSHRLGFCPQTLYPD